MEKQLYYSLQTLLCSVRHVKPFDPKLRGRKVLKVVTWLPTVDKHSFVGLYFSAKECYIEE